jgi:hypothetical protein
MVSVIGAIVVELFARPEVRERAGDLPGIARSLKHACRRFSKKLECLEAAIALYLAHYDFCRLHGTLGKMAAGLAGHPGTMAELVERCE